MIATRFCRRRGQRRLACAMRGARVALPRPATGSKSSAPYAVPSPSLLYSPGHARSVAAFSLRNELRLFVHESAFLCLPGPLHGANSFAHTVTVLSARGVESTQRIARAPVAINLSKISEY